MSTDRTSPDSMSADIPASLTPILVATDFSDNARTAADWAIDIARTHGAAIRLLHVLTLPAPRPHYAPAPPDLQQALQKAAVEQLDAEAERLSDRGIEVETSLEIGIPSQTITHFAEKIRPALLVIGTRGLTGLSHLLLGSTAERVVQHATCPVLTIHPEDTGKQRTIRNILVPTDFSDHAEQAIQTANRLLAPLERDAKLVLLHAFNLPIEYTAYGPIPTSVGYLEDTGLEAQEHLDKMAGGLRSKGMAVETVAREGYPPEVIVAEAERTGADVIVMGTHGRSGLAHLLLGSTAERVVQKAPCPVITVRYRKED